MKKRSAPDSVWTSSGKNVTDILDRLTSLAEPEYRDFTAKLTPGCLPPLGVRLPVLRSMAMELAGNKTLYTAYFSYIRSGRAKHHEEVLLHGLTIGYIKTDIETVLALLEAFMPLVTNWAVCDSTCATLHIIKKHRERVWNFLLPYLDSGKTYDIRVVVVVLLDYYITEDYVQRVLGVLDSIHSEDYYVSMAAAWCLSVCYVKFPEEVFPYLEKNNLDDATYNRALQKITESFRCPGEMKERIRSMKRNNRV